MSCLKFESGWQASKEILVTTKQLKILVDDTFSDGEIEALLIDKV